LINVFETEGKKKRGKRRDPGVSQAKNTPPVAGGGIDSLKEPRKKKKKTSKHSNEIKN